MHLSRRMWRLNGGVIIPNKDTARALNDLARHKAIVRILNDIRMDMEICEIEGWDKNEYLNLIRQLLNSIGGKTMNDSISRQQAIDALDCINGTEEVLRRLPPAQPEPPWIPCEERMPEEHDSIFAKLKGSAKWNPHMFEKVSDHVDVTVELIDGTRVVDTAKTKDGKWSPDRTYFSMGEVIAWRERPEPYRGDCTEESKTEEPRGN